MADEADLAMEQEEREREMMRKYHMSVLPRHQPRIKNGICVCLNCDTHVDDGVRWCDKYCQEDFLRRVG